MKTKCKEFHLRHCSAHTFDQSSAVRVCLFVHARYVLWLAMFLWRSTISRIDPDEQTLPLIYCWQATIIHQMVIYTSHVFWHEMRNSYIGNRRGALLRRQRQNLMRLIQRDKDYRRFLISFLCLAKSSSVSCAVHCRVEGDVLLPCLE